MTIYDSQAVLIVFGSNLTGRVRTECADLIVEGRCVVYKLCLVEVLVEELHDLVADLNTDADVDGSDFGIDSVVIADVGEPVGAFTSDGGDDLICVVCLIFIGDNTLCGTVLDDDILDHGVEFHVDSVREKVFLQSCVDLITFLGSEVADRAFDEL